MQKIFIIWAVISGFITVTQAAPGDLDAGFYAGRVTTGISNSQVPSDIAEASAVQPDGKIVVAGNYAASPYRVFVARYNPDGSLDATFDGDGLVTLGELTLLRAVKILSDGKILVAGMTSSTDAALVRFNADGSLDATFNGTGIVLSSGFFTDAIRAMALQPDGKIVVAGGNQFEVMRFNADGSVDPSFDGDGYAIYSFPAFSSPAFGLALQTDGKIVVTGWAGIDNNPRYDFGVVRFNTDGSLDPSFDGDGAVNTNFNSNFNDYAWAVAIQTDGKILAGGRIGVAGSPSFFSMGLARYNPDGSLDPSFDGDGKVVTTIGVGADDVIKALAVQPDGKILAGGTAGFAAGGGSEPTGNFAVVRYHPDGSLDPLFNGTGKATAAISTTFTGSQASGSTVNALTLQPNGKIVLAGVDRGFVGLDIALARFNSDGTLDGSFGNRILTPTGRQFDRVKALAIQSDGKIVAGGTGNYFFGSAGDILITRYNSDGLLDSGFHFDGLVTFEYFQRTYNLNSLIIQNVEGDERILAAGSSTINGNADFLLTRTFLNGNPDGSVGQDPIDGHRTTPVGSGDDVAYAAAVYPNDKMIAAGSSHNGANLDFALVRYEWFGQLDPTFDTDGLVTTAIGTGDDVAYAAAVQTDGKIVLAGKAGNGANDDFALARYNSDGSLDPSFNGTGKVVTPVGGGRDVIYSLKIQPDGKILVAGVSDNGANDDFALARYHPNGALDTSFDDDGIVTTAIGGGDDIAYSLAIQTGGKIVVAGSADNGADLDFAVVRYYPTGALDTTFDALASGNLGKGSEPLLAGDGKVTIAIGSGDDVARSVAIQTDNKIVVAGHAQNGSSDDFALLRLNGNLAPTAANVSIAGRVSNAKTGIARVAVSLTDGNGRVRTALTNSFGRYRFDEVPVGQTYVVAVGHRKYVFSPDSQILNISEAVENIDFTAAE
jgi:uncharacterized delta-60 repeat protein